MTPFYVVWNPRAGSPTRRHPDPNSALAEAARLAKANPDEEFYVLRTLGFACVRRSPCTWNPAIPDDIPDDMPF